MKNQYSFDDAIRNIVQQENKIILKKIEQLFEKLSNFKEDSKIMTFKEVCDYLSCSKSYLYKQTSANQIPHSKRGKRLFFEKAKLTKWILENQVKTDEEISEEVYENFQKS